MINRETAAQLLPKKRSFEQLCFFRDFIILRLIPPVPENEVKEVDFSVDEAVNVRLPSLARSAYFMLQFLAYTYLGKKSPSSSPPPYTDCTVSSEAFIDMFNLLGSADDDPSILEVKVRDKLCEIFKLESRDEAKKHDWFKFFTFCDWTWLFGKERSFLDFAPGKGPLPSSVTRDATQGGGFDDCLCQEQSSATMYQICLREIARLIRDTGTHSRSTTAYIQYWDTIWTDTVKAFHSRLDSCNDEREQTMNAIAVAFPRLMSHLVNKMVIGFVTYIDVKTRGFKLNVLKTPGNVSRLLFLEHYASLRHHTNQTAMYLASDDMAAKESALQYCSNAFQSIRKQLEDFRLCLMTLEADLL